MPSIFMNSGPDHISWNLALGRFLYGRILIHFDWSDEIDLVLDFTNYAFIFVERFGLICPGFHENRENERGIISSTERTLASRIPSTILHPHHKYSFNLQHRGKKLGHNLVSAVSKLGHTWHVPYSEVPRSSDYYYSYLCRLRASLLLVLETLRRLLELVPCNHLLEQHPLAPIPAY